MPTHVAPKYDYNIDAYSAYNKPLAITHWLQNTKARRGPAGGGGGVGWGGAVAGACETGPVC